MRLSLPCFELVLIVAVTSALPEPTLFCQQTSQSSADQDKQQSDKHILGIIPNYRTSPSLGSYQPLAPREKFKIAADDAFDRGNFAMAALFAGEAQLTDTNPSFGQGVKGYAHYFVTTFADLSIGDFMTEAIFPIVLHQDPRYFRRGSGSGWSRFGYSAGQILFTHNDSGRIRFNFSEIVGNSAAVAISNAYYPDGRNVTDATLKLGEQIAVDTVGNLLKEFWPDLARKLSRKDSNSKTP